MREFEGRKFIAFGERDGVQGRLIGECLRGGGLEVVLELTQCFV
jgi:hypothetical protein